MRIAASSARRRWRGELVGAGRPARGVAFDLTDAAAGAGRDRALLAAGPIQVLVNNAGIHRDALLAGMRRRSGTT